MPIKYKIYKVTDGQGKVHCCVSETTGRVWHFNPKTETGQVVYMEQDLRHIGDTCRGLGFEIEVIDKTHDGENMNSLLGDFDKGLTPDEKYLSLKSKILSVIDEIDGETPFQENEPFWWLEMMHLRKSVEK